MGLRRKSAETNCRLRAVLLSMTQGRDGSNGIRLAFQDRHKMVHLGHSAKLLLVSERVATRQRV